MSAQTETPETAAASRPAAAVEQAVAAERARIVAWLREWAESGDIDGHAPNVIEGAALEWAADHLATEPA